MTEVHHGSVIALHGMFPSLGSVSIPSSIMHGGAWLLLELGLEP